MERSLRIVDRHDHRRQRADDLAYWLSRPMAERIAAVETLRQQAFSSGAVIDAEPRLQRVCRVVVRQRG